MPDYELGISSAETVTLLPTFEMLNGLEQIRADHRAQSGNRYSYTFGDFRKITMDLTFVSSSDRALINSWHESNAELILFEVDSSTTAYEDLTMINKASPIQRFQKPYTNLFRGRVELEGF